MRRVGFLTALVVGIVAGQTKFSSGEVRVEDLGKIFDRGGAEIEFPARDYQTPLMPVPKTPLGLKSVQREVVPKRLQVLFQNRGTKKGGKGDVVVQTGRFVPTYHDSIQKYDGYNSLVGLTFRKRFELLELDQRNAFGAEVKGIGEEKGKLLDISSAIDKRDEDLYGQYVVLKKEVDNLEKWRLDLNSRIANYNSQCANIPNPPSYCSTWRTRLVNEKAQYDAVRQDLISRSATFNEKVDRLKSDNAEFVQRISKWATAINTTSKNILTAIDNIREDCNFTGNRDDEDLCIYRCDWSGRRLFPPDPSTNRCIDPRLEEPLPPDFPQVLLK